MVLVGFENEPVAIIGATNRLQDIDPAFRRRLGRLIEIQVGTEVSRFVANFFLVIHVDKAPRCYTISNHSSFKSLHYLWFGLTPVSLTNNNNILLLFGVVFTLSLYHMDHYRYDLSLETITHMTYV